jgi:hypothetical protein
MKIVAFLTGASLRHVRLVSTHEATREVVLGRAAEFRACEGYVPPCREPLRLTRAAVVPCGLAPAR